MPEENEDGWIALKRYQTIPREHVDQVLSITKMCCGGNRKPMFRYANALDVHRWVNGGR
jgi:hypothetical protein